MPIKVITNDENEILKFQGGKFYYKRPPLKMKKKWTRENTNRHGIIDFYGIMEKAVDYCLLNWDDKAVIDADNKPVSYSPELALMLSEEFYLEFGDALGISNPDSDEPETEVKNLKSTSS